jgi:ABC-type multidrug transport system fused ATPase/permease subunit
MRQDMAFFDKEENATGALTARLATEVCCLRLRTLHVTTATVTAITHRCTHTVVLHQLSGAAYIAYILYNVRLNKLEISVHAVHTLFDSPQSHQATLVKAVVGQNIGRLFQNLMTVVAAFVVAFVWGAVQLTAILAAVLPVLVLASIWQMRVVRGSSTQSQESVATAGSLAVQALDGVRTVTAFNAAGPIMELYRK